MEKRPGTALLLVGHGSTTNPDSSPPTRRLAEKIGAMNIFDEVKCCFWKEEPHLHKVLQELSSHDVFIVPNFISEGYFTQTVIPREMVLLKRAAETAPGVNPLETSLLLVGHGTSLNKKSSDAVKKQASLIASLGLYAEVLPCTMEPMDDVPLISDWGALTLQRNVVVIPFFISDGLHSYQDIPVLLGLREELGPAACESDVFKHNPHHLQGKNLFYGSAIGTDPGMADAVLDQVQEALNTVS